jgi:hypothetical protein
MTNELKKLAIRYLQNSYLILMGSKPKNLF